MLKTHHRQSVQKQGIATTQESNLSTYREGLKEFRSSRRSEGVVYAEDIIGQQHLQHNTTSK